MTTPLTGDRGRAGARGSLRRDTVLVVVGQVAAVVSGLLVALVGARVLPTAEFGALSWALSWLTFLAVLAQFGLPQVATIAVARQARRTHASLLRRLVLAQAVGVLATAALWQWAVGPAAVAAGTPATAYRPLVLLVALWLPAAALCPVLVNVLRARNRFGLALVFGEHVRRVVLVVVLLAGAAGAAATLSARAAVAWTVAVETAVVLLALLLLAREVAPAGRHAAGRAADDGPDEGTSGDGRDGGGSPWRLLGTGRAFAVASLASVTLPQAGVWLLAVVAPVEEVAVFAVAVRIAVLVAVPTAVGVRTLAPRVAAASAADRLGALAEPVRRFAVWSTAATATAVVLLGATGPVVLPALFGPEYAAAVVPALVMSAGVLVNAWTGPCSVVLSHAGHQRAVALSALAAALAFAGLATWWGGAWGATGVAAAAAVAMSARNLHLARAAHRVLGVRTTARPRGGGS
ncbi:MULTISPECIES: lipopolysaccharide biosynthesis protein [unclassified Blastococcus]|uniref:lipopolysaccharide biosynthesis protein n=1 Tax=unclassified Blastococcus TaxID=2619396 RepID=UPI001EF10D74|nr:MULTISPECIES: oligosaccharide flippase family protein [unclassified Blastococcus]